MISVVVSQRKPRGDDCERLAPGDTRIMVLPPAIIEVKNTYGKELYLKWRI